jgi:hypothetical protein
MNTITIKRNLINSCLNQKPKDFIPYLLSEKVKIKMPNKTRFYRFFKYMLKCVKNKSTGKWTLKIENTSWNNGKAMAYNFYDEKHKYARLSIMITEQNDRIILETMPF